MKDLMLDLETMGSGIGSVITQIGACYFDRYSGEVGQKFNINVDMEDAVREGFRIEPGAVKFWLGQPGRSFLVRPEPIRYCLGLFHEYAEKADCIWSHATFDFSMIQDAYQKLGMKPLKYRKTKDIRTLMELAGTHKMDDTLHPESAHDALSDAIYQVGYCVKAFNILKIKSDGEKGGEG